MPLKLKKLENPMISVILISIVLLILIFVVHDPRSHYGDSGLMFLQVHDLVESDFSSFAFRYPAEILDPDYLMVPFRKPFLAAVGDRHYIDFPPYFPLMNGAFFALFSYHGLYIINFVSFMLTILLLSRMPGMIGLSRSYGHLIVILYSFATTASLYAFFFHEYTIAIALVTLSLFLYLRYIFLERKYWMIILSGLIGGISLFFRLEIIFIYLMAGLVIMFHKKKWDLASAGLYGVAFLIPFLLLLFFNNEIHGHPLGLRYSLTMDSAAASVPGAKQISLIEVHEADQSRTGIIVALLFSKMRGMLYQSPFFALAFLAVFGILWDKQNRSRIWPLLSVFFGGMGITLLTAPNHGDHFAPRYLFGLYPFGLLLSLYVISKTHEFLRHRSKYLQMAVLLAGVILMYHGVRIWTKNYFWIQSLDGAVLGAEDVIHRQKEDVIVYIEYASPLNTVRGFAEKKIVVIDDLNKRERFLDAMVKNGLDTFAVALPVSGRAGLETMNRFFTDGRPDPVKLGELSPVLSLNNRMSLVNADYEAPFIIMRYKIAR